MRAMFKPVAIAAVMVVGVLAAGAASAQIAVGGGATLPELLYDDALPSGVGLTDFSYTGTGSGAGKTAFFTNNATGFKNESLATTPAWGATQSVHFAGSDSLMTAAERNSYTNDVFPAGGTQTRQAAWGRQIQLPTVATSVLIPYKRTGVSTLNLTDAQMCAVFANKPLITTTQPNLMWEQVLGTATTANPGTNLVRVVYRSETSGTTELLSRYLVEACPGAGFVVSNSFTTAVAGALSAATGSSAIPAHWVAVTGSSGMSGAFGTDGRVGYLSPEPLYTGSNNAVVARINGNLPSSSAIKTQLAGTSLPVGGASQSTDPLAWVPAYSKPASGYPIFGTTNILVNQCYKDAAVQTKVRNFLAKIYGLPAIGANPATLPDSATMTKVANHNFIALPDGSVGTNNWNTQIKNVFLNPSNPLGIGNTSVCASVGRPLTN
ncbi:MULTISPECIES: substrate-binding domain-containing protein [Variovorax]|uniref:substrate-binding domain-containing protein n=1 Tax=Variovorax paradoxus TaxID=34073 RepID=UPI00193135E9|nr:substrate-binding domain-containing protein [Variovorax paradoxus]